MIPTKQDNELRDKVATIIEYWDFSPLQDEDSRIERLKNEIMQLITADRKRVALEAFDEGYEAGRKEKPPKLVDAVEFRRESYGWSKGKMAAMLDMTKSHYSEFIHGTRGLPVNSIRKAYAIGIPAQVFRQDYIDRQLKAQQEESK